MWQPYKLPCNVMLLHADIWEQRQTLIFCLACRLQEVRCHYQEGMKFQVSDTANFMAGTVNIIVARSSLHVACGSMELSMCFVHLQPL
jgi:hypothetical protein